MTDNTTKGYDKMEGMGMMSKECRVQRQLISSLCLYSIRLITSFPLFPLKVSFLWVASRREVGQQKHRTTRPFHGSPHDVLADDKGIGQPISSIVVRVEIVERG